MEYYIKRKRLLEETHGTLLLVKLFNGDILKNNGT